MTLYARLIALSRDGTYWMRWIVPGVIGVLILTNALAIYEGAGPSQRILEMTQEMKVAPSPGMLTIQLTVDKRRVCESSTDRILWRWERRDDGSPIDTTRLGDVPPTADAIPHYVLLQAGSIPVTKLGKQTLRISIPVPHAVPGGVWFYRTVRHDRCSWIPSWNHVTRTTDVPVPILPWPGG